MRYRGGVGRNCLEFVGIGVDSVHCARTGFILVLRCRVCILSIDVSCNGSSVDVQFAASAHLFAGAFLLALCENERILSSIDVEKLLPLLRR